MSKFRQKTEIIEAVQFNPLEQPWPTGIKPWSSAGYQPRDCSWGYIQTPEGTKHVQNGDWLVTNEAGEKHLYQDWLFKEMYEPVEE